MINDLIAEPGFFYKMFLSMSRVPFFLVFTEFLFFSCFFHRLHGVRLGAFRPQPHKPDIKKQGPARNDAKQDGLSRLEVSTFRAISSDFSEFEFVEPPTLNLQIHVLVSLQLHICQFLGGSACANNSFIQQSKANKFKFCNFVELPMFWDC